VPIFHVASLDDPAHARALAHYADLREPDLAARPIERARVRAGLFIAEGELVLRALASSRFGVESVLVAAPRLVALGPTLDALPPGTPVYAAAPGLIDELTGFHVHRGVLALGRRPAANDPAELLARAPLAVVLEDLTNHDNVGSIFRVVSALAPAGSVVLLSPGCCDPLYRKSLRVSMGHALRVPFATLADWPSVLAGLPALGFWPIGLTPGGDVVLPGLRSRLPCPRPALVLGSEGPGLTPGALRACAARVRIPMAAGVDSLNVAAAAAIALYELSARG
jgi:tRNA G18 (ribose-2'-O)-methylase SpoU